MELDGLMKKEFSLVGLIRDGQMSLVEVVRAWMWVSTSCVLLKKMFGRL